MRFFELQSRMRHLPCLWQRLLMRRWYFIRDSESLTRPRKFYMTLKYANKLSSTKQKLGGIHMYRGPWW